MSKSASLRSIELSDNGGHYYRADFQVHTPRDAQWDGARPQNEAQREVWADDFVAAARAKDLHAVAISDHHDFALFPYVKRAAQREMLPDGEPIPTREQLVVFPALELSLTVPCQAILILDAEFPVDRLDDVLKALHFEPFDPSLPAAPQATNLEDSGDLNRLHSKLDKHQWLKGRYIILPNVSPKGYRTLMRDQFQGKYRDMIPVGGYIDGSVTKFESKNNKGTKKILDGEVSAWGSKRLALFQTSDSRSADHKDLGEHSTWVKWVEPTAEAIRQACLAQESRISQSSPSMPNIWISRIVVSQSKFMGHIDVSTNPQFTALIGGRGTGKSTILDYLRWALCDQPARSSEDDEVADPRVRQRRLVDATLKPLGAHVEIHCIINGIEHVVRRSAADGSVQLKVGDAEFEEVRESAIQSLLPIQAYSQKQLSSVAIRTDELLRFVTSPIQGVLENIDRKQQEVVGRLRENYGSLQRHRDLTSEIQRTELRVRSLAEQAQALRDGLSGLSDDDRKILNEKSAHDEVRSASKSWMQHIETRHAELVELLEGIDGSLEAVTSGDEGPNEVQKQVAELYAATRTTLVDLRTKLGLAAEELQESLAEGGRLAVPSAALEQKLEAYEGTYAAVKVRSSAHEVKLAELSKLEELQKVAANLVRAQTKERDALGNPIERHKGLRGELLGVRKERTVALTLQCDDLAGLSGGIIKATLSGRRGFAEAQSKLKALITGSNVRSNKIESVFEELVQEPDPASTWEVVLEELESLMLLEPDADFTSQLTPTLSRLGLAVSDQKKLAPRLTPDGWLDLSLTSLADSPEFEYRAKEDDYIPFSSASAGQQASALLATLLSQGGTPLIIDQPEDDLDSDTVQQIVTKIWPSKSRRQLIFSSHNANLVVNGDADLVLVCAYVNSGDQSAGHIKQQGAIDVAAVRDEITSVMEGGEKAFRLRKEKYGF